MTFNQIIDGIEDLARSQGFYGRLLDDIFTLPEEDLERLAVEWEAQNFQDMVDFILYIEG